MLDTSLLLPALLARKGQPHGRSLLVLLGFGALTLRELTLEEELRLLTEEAKAVGGTLHWDTRERELDALRRRREEIRAELPIRAPDDLCLIGSRLLFDEVERKVTEIGHRFDPQLPDNAGATARRIVEALTAVLVEISPHEKLPPHTPDPNDDYLIEMAYRAEAYAVVSRDQDVVPEPMMIWSDERRQVRVPGYWQGPFVAEHVENSGFRLADVDPALLQRVLAPLA